jgi:hypothetical protein
MHKPIEIYFTRDQKTYIDKLGKKSKTDYLLNVNKVIREKLEADFVVPNDIQAFMLNYEIGKIIDKVLNTKNRKYTRLIYLNYNLDFAVALTTLDFMRNKYSDIAFTAYIIECDDEFEAYRNNPDITVISSAQC